MICLATQVNMELKDALMHGINGSAANEPTCTPGKATDPETKQLEI